MLHSPHRFEGTPDEEAKDELSPDPLKQFPIAPQQFNKILKLEAKDSKATTEFPKIREVIAEANTFINHGRTVPPKYIDFDLLTYIQHRLLVAMQAAIRILQLRARLRTIERYYPKPSDQKTYLLTRIDEYIQKTLSPLLDPDLEDLPGEEEETDEVEDEDEDEDEELKQNEKRKNNDEKEEDNEEEEVNQDETTKAFVHWMKVMRKWTKPPAALGQPQEKSNRPQVKPYQQTPIEYDNDHQPNLPIDSDLRRPRVTQSIDKTPRKFKRKSQAPDLKKEALLLVNWVDKFLSPKQPNELKEAQINEILKRNLLTPDGKPKPCLLCPLSISDFSHTLAIDIINYDVMSNTGVRKTVFAKFLNNHIYPHLNLPRRISTRLIPFICYLDGLYAYVVLKQLPPTMWLELNRKIIAILRSSRSQSRSLISELEKEAVTEKKEDANEKLITEVSQQEITDLDYRYLISMITSEFQGMFENLNSTIRGLLIKDLTYRNTAHELQESLKLSYETALTTSFSLKEFIDNLKQQCFPVLEKYKKNYQQYQSFRQQHFPNHPSPLPPPYSQGNQEGVLNVVASSFEAIKVPVDSNSPLVIQFISYLEDLESYLIDTQLLSKVWPQLINKILAILRSQAREHSQSSIFEIKTKTKENKVEEKKRVSKAELMTKSSPHAINDPFISQQFVGLCYQLNSTERGLLIEDLTHRQAAYQLQASLKSRYHTALTTSRSLKSFNHQLKQRCSPVLARYQKTYQQHHKFRQQHFPQQPSRLIPPYSQRDQKGLLNLTAAHFAVDHEYCFWLNPCKLPQILRETAIKASLIFNLMKPKMTTAKASAEKKEKPPYIGDVAKEEKDEEKESDKEEKKSSKIDLTAEPKGVPGVESKAVTPASSQTLTSALAQAIPRLNTLKNKQPFKWTTAIRNWFLSLIGIHSFPRQQQFRNWLYLCQYIHFLVEKESATPEADNAALRTRVDASIAHFSHPLGVITNNRLYLQTLHEVKSALNAPGNTLLENEVIDYTSLRVSTHMGLYVQPFEQVKDYLTCRAMENFDNQGSRQTANITEYPQRFKRWITREAENFDNQSQRISSFTDYLERFQSWTTILIEVNGVLENSDHDIIKAKLTEKLTQAINTFYKYGRSNRYAGVLKNLLAAVRDGRVFFHQQIKLYIQQQAELHVKELEVIYKFRAWTIAPLGPGVRESLFDSLRTYQQHYQQYLEKPSFVSANAALCANDAIYNAETQTGILHKLLPPALAKKLWEDFVKASTEPENSRTNTSISSCGDGEEKKKLGQNNGDISNASDRASTSTSAGGSLDFRLSTATTRTTTDSDPPPPSIGDNKDRLSTASGLSERPSMEQPSSTAEQASSGSARRSSTDDSPRPVGTPRVSEEEKLLPSDAPTRPQPSRHYDSQIRGKVVTLINETQPKLPTSILSWNANPDLRADYNQLRKLSRALEASKFTILSPEIIPIEVNDLVMQTAAKIKTPNIKNELLTAIESPLVVSLNNHLSQP